MKFIVFVGVTVWEILTFSARPYSNLTSRELLGALYNGVRLEQPVTCSLDLYSVLLKCECIPLMVICYKSFNNKVGCLMIHADRHSVIWKTP